MQSLNQMTFPFEKDVNDKFTGWHIKLVKNTLVHVVNLFHDVYYKTGTCRKGMGPCCYQNCWPFINRSLSDPKPRQWQGMFLVQYKRQILLSNKVCGCWNLVNLIAIQQSIEA